MVARFWSYPILFAGFFTLGLLRPELPGILLELFGGAMESVATFQGICDGFSALFAFFAVPLLGNFCDGAGRKPGLTIAACSAAMPVFVLCAYQLLALPKTLTLVMYFLANMVSRVTTQSVVFSYVADCSAIDKRAGALVEAGGVLYLAQTAGPSVAKYLSRQNSLLIAASLCIGSVVYSFVIPESHKPKPPDVPPSYGTVEHEKGTADSPNERHDSHKYGQGKGVLVGLRFLSSTPIYTAIAVVLFFSQMAMSGVGQIYYLYLTEEFQFKRADNLLCAMIGGFQTCVIMLLIQPRLTKFVSLSTAMAFAMANYCIYCLGLSFFASNKVEVLSLIIFYGFAAVMFSSTNALLASVTMPHQLGLAMGALAAVKAFASGFGSMVFGLFFGGMVTLKHTYGADLIPGIKLTSLPLLAGCLVASGVLVACLFLPLDIRVHSKKWKDTIIKIITMQRVLSASGSHTNCDEYCFLPSHIALPGHVSKQLSEERHALHPQTKPPPSPAPPSRDRLPKLVKMFWHHEAKDLPKVPVFLPSGTSHDDNNILAIPRLPARSNSQRVGLAGGLTAFILTALFACKGVGKIIDAEQITVMNSDGTLRAQSTWAGPGIEGQESTRKEGEGQTSASHMGLTIISLLGPPGVGKSALSRHITPDFGFEHVSTGDLIREEIQAGSEIGLRTAAIVKAGGLVDDETVTMLIEKKLAQLNASANGIILDGFPRRLSQAQLLDSGKFKIPRLAAVVSVTMPDHILDIRRSGRRVCPVCGATYNLHAVDQEGYYLKARLPCHDRCCVENATLVPRPDDEPKIAADRMRVYHEETPAMLKYYHAEHNLIEIEKQRQMKIVYKDIKPQLAALVHLAQKRQKKQLQKSA